MTCIVGLIENGAIYMGADSAGVAGCFIQRRADSKVFINGEFVFGFTTSFRMGQLLQYNLSIPKIKEGQSVIEFMTTDFIDAVRNCLKAGGYTKIENGVEIGGQFLVGYKGRLFHIDNDFQVGELIGKYASIGCGQDIALGSMFSTNGQNAEDRIKLALEAAEEFNNAVRSPFNILKISCDKPILQEPK